MATTKRLTDREVKAAAPGKHRDGAGHGLYVLVAPSGARRWKQRVTIRGRRRELGLGGYPAVSLAAARERARENAAAARAGRDPLAERAVAVAAAVTFAEAAVRVHAMYRPRWRNAKHAHEWIATLERFAFPSIGDLSVAEIDVEHVLGVVVPLGRSRTGCAPTTPPTRRGCCSRRRRRRHGRSARWTMTTCPARSLGSVTAGRRRRRGWPSSSWC